MSLSTNKTKVDTTVRVAQHLPDLPNLLSLSLSDKSALSDWWRLTKQTIQLMEDRLYSKLDDIAP